MAVGCVTLPYKGGHLCSTGHVLCRILQGIREPAQVLEIRSNCYFFLWLSLLSYGFIADMHSLLLQPYSSVEIPAW